MQDFYWLVQHKSIRGSFCSMEMLMTWIADSFKVFFAAPLPGSYTHNRKEHLENLMVGAAYTIQHAYSRRSI